MIKLSFDDLLLKMTDNDFIEALENGTYSRLEIKRYGMQCFLIVEIDGKSRVLINSKGKRKVFRHGWQIKDWLKSRFDIDLEESE